MEDLRVTVIKKAADPMVMSCEMLPAQGHAEIQVLCEDLRQKYRKEKPGIS